MIKAYPLVVRQRTMAAITLRPAAPLVEGARYRVVHTCCEEYENHPDHGETIEIGGVPITHSDNRPQALYATAAGGELRLRLCLEGEQEHIFRIFAPDGAPCGTASVYSLGDGLCGLLPFKGDFHLHSVHSDGRQHPQEVAAACRGLGYDFMALTDHGKMAPSRELMRFYEGRETGLRLLPGEEIHLPRHPVHLLNIGGRGSVNEACRRDMAGYARQVAALLEAPGLRLRAGVHPYMAAASLWALQKTRELGGMSVLCHPYWRRGSGYNQSTPLTDWLLERQDFDALELISGYTRQEADANNLQVAKYMELRAAGRRIPVVGASDSHSVRPLPDFPFDTLLGWYYTLVLAKSSRFADIREGILAGNSAAAEQMPGAPLRLWGNYRLVKYFLFLAREFFPAHDALARPQGEAMARLAAGGGGEGEEEALRRGQEGLGALYRAAFCF